MIGARQLAEHERVKPIRLAARSAEPRAGGRDLVGVKRQHPQPSIQQWFNRAAFAQPADGQFGNLRINNLFGPGSIRIDMGLTRTFRLREKQTFEFRAEAFNVPNHVNLNNPASTALSNPTFGVITTVQDPRILQFALKYGF